VFRDDNSNRWRRIDLHRLCLPRIPAYDKIQGAYPGARLYLLVKQTRLVSPSQPG
jgi:hypothetical protein